MSPGIFPLIPLWRAARHSREHNAIDAYFRRRNRRASQRAMLLVASVFSVVVLALLGLYIVRNEWSLLFWIAARWGISEFLWSWMAADHCFSEIGQARRSGMMDQMRLTAHSPPEIAEGFSFSTWRMLLAGIALEAAATMLLVFWFLQGMQTDILISLMAAILLGTAAFTGHASTAAMAASTCMWAALQKSVDTLTWAGTLAGIGLWLLLYLVVALLAALIVILVVSDTDQRFGAALLVTPCLLMLVGDWLKTRDALMIIGASAKRIAEMPPSGR